MMNVNGKTKESLKARTNINESCRRIELWIQELQNGKIVKLKDDFSLN